MTFVCPQISQAESWPFQKRLVCRMKIPLFNRHSKFVVGQAVPPGGPGAASRSWPWCLPAGGAQCRLAQRAAQTRTKGEHWNKIGVSLQNLATPWSPDDVRALRRAATQREARRMRRRRTTARRSQVRVEYTSTLGCSIFTLFLN